MSLGAIAAIAFMFNPITLVITISAALLMGGQIIAALCSIMMTITLIVLIIWFVQIAVIAMLSLSLVVLISPLFLICMLFEPVKPFYQAWLKQLVAPVVILIVLITYLSLIMTLLDKEFFGSLKFQRLAGSSIYVLDDSNGDQCGKGKENEYILACVVQKFGTTLNDEHTVMGIRITSTGEVNTEATEKFWSSALRMTLICFLAVMLADNLMTSLAAELSGVYQANYGGMVKGAGALIKSGAAASSSAAGKAGSLANKAVSKIEEKRKGSSSRDGGGDSGGVGS